MQLCEMTLLQVLTPAYRNRVKDRAEALMETYEGVTRSEKLRVRDTQVMTQLATLVSIHV